MDRRTKKRIIRLLLKDGCCNSSIFGYTAVFHLKNNAVVVSLQNGVVKVNSSQKITNSTGTIVREAYNRACEIYTELQKFSLLNPDT